MIILGVTIRWNESFVLKRDNETNEISRMPFMSLNRFLLHGLGSLFTDGGDIYDNACAISENNEFYVGCEEDFSEDYIKDETTITLPFVYLPHIRIYPNREELDENLLKFVNKYLKQVSKICQDDDMIDIETFLNYEIVGIDIFTSASVAFDSEVFVSAMDVAYHTPKFRPRPCVKNCWFNNDFYKPIVDTNSSFALEKNKRYTNELEILKAVENDIYRGVPTAYIVEERDSETVAKNISEIMVEKKLLLSQHRMSLNLSSSNRTSRIEQIMFGDGNVIFIKVGKIIESNKFDIDTDYTLSITKTQLKNMLDGRGFADNKNGIISQYKKDSLIFFTINSKATENTLLKLCEEVHFNVKTLCLDAFTDRDEVKKIFDEYATRDRFEEYTGTIRNSPYMISEIRQEYDTWKSNKLFEMIGGKVNTAEDVKESDKDCLGKLNNLIGLEEVKKSVIKIINAFRMQKLYKEKGIINETPSRHMVFYGSPGTAKTTVARLIGDILKTEGILPSGEFVEVGREDLIGEYVGQTAPKTKQAFQKAKGGILFIDEAYSLMSKDHYGSECIATIVKEMENNREDTIVIFAGYQDKMKDFIDFNEGMKSRIAFHLKFDDYSVDELMEINAMILKEQKFSMTYEAIEKTCKLVSSRIGQKNFGNGRFVRSLVEQSIMNLSDRLVKSDKSVSDLSIDELTTITEQDIADMSEIDKVQHNIGFGTRS